MNSKCYAEYAYDDKKRYALFNLLKNPDSEYEKELFLHSEENRQLFKLDDVAIQNVPQMDGKLLKLIRIHKWLHNKSLCGKDVKRR